jgi:uncharacterized surface protein with fasciclin (FAS1) repeats
MKKLIPGLMLFLCPFLYHACVDSDDVGDSFTTFKGTVISAYLTEHADLFSDFTEALKKVDAFVLLESYGKYTCFIPTNEAMQAYYREKGKTLDEFTTEELKEMVFYHLIDGEKHATGAYYTYSFVNGAIDTENMIGRYIYTSLPAGTPDWQLNKTATIITPDLEMGNGVVHIVNRVLEGNNDLLPDLIESDRHFTLYAEALRITGLRDSMLLIEDKSYVQPATLPDGNPNTQRDHYPEKKKYGFTALIEPDSILKLREGIETLNDMRAYAKSIYDVMYPQDAGIADETDRRNSLNRFVSYHFLPCKLQTNYLVETYGYITEEPISIWFTRTNEILQDGKYIIEQYLVPMCPNTLISVQKGNIFNEARNAFFTNLNSADDAIRLISDMSDIDCQNGIIHGLNNMLVYDRHVESQVLHKRLRMELRTFLPEFINNEVVSFHKNRFNQWHRYIPEGFAKNLKFKEERPDMFMVYHAPNVHPYYYGDELIIKGFFDLTITVGPIPAGKYEVRYGYHANPTSRGITQFYLDGVPCGIPADMRLRATDPLMGWEKAGNNPDDPYGFENDKSMHNRGFMKAPDSYMGTVLYQNNMDTESTARDHDLEMRRILSIVTWPETGTHELRLVQMLNGDCLLDYIEFMPVDLLDTEDTH